MLSEDDCTDLFSDQFSLLKEKQTPKKTVNHEGGMTLKEIYLVQSAELNTTFWKRVCGLHYSNDLMSLLP